MTRVPSYSVLFDTEDDDYLYEDDIADDTDYEREYEDLLDEDEFLRDN